MVRSHYLPEKTYRVPLTGYSTYKGNSIYFRFKGYPTKRTYSLTGYDLTTICERYDVELCLKEHSNKEHPLTPRDVFLSLFIEVLLEFMQ